VSKRRIRVMDEGQLRMKPRGGTLTSTQQAKRKLVFHFPGGRSYHLTGAESYNVYTRSAIGFGRIFLQSFYNIFWGNLLDPRPQRLAVTSREVNEGEQNEGGQELTSRGIEEYETGLRLARETIGG
jgi:hypothetical protein